MRLITLIIVIQLITACFSMANDIRGTVLTDGQPLMLASVGLEGTSLGTTTDESGRFELLNVPKGEYRIVITHVGYFSYEENIKVAGNKYFDLNVNMKSQLIQLEELVFTGTRTE